MRDTNEFYGATIFHAGEPEIGIPHFSHRIDFGFDLKTFEDCDFNRNVLREKIKALFEEVLGPEGDIFVSFDDECSSCMGKEGKHFSWCEVKHEQG